MHSQLLTSTRRLACVAVVAVACAGTGAATALACPAAPGFPGDPGGGGSRAVQRHALPRVHAKAAVRLVCSSVYPLSCHASAQK